MDVELVETGSIAATATINIVEALVGATECFAEGLFFVISTIFSTRINDVAGVGCQL
jgi:hypothetical protein